MPSIHFTHHPCVQHGLWKPHDEPRPWKPDPLSQHGRNPRLWFCRAWSRPARARRCASTNAAEVNCRWCHASMAEDTQNAWQAKARRAEQHAPESVRESNVRFWSNWADDRELTTRAWLTCCKDHGAPWPYSEQERIASERWYRAVRVRQATVMFVIVTPYGPPSSVAGDLAERFAELDAGDRALFAPAIADARRADELLTEASRLLASINTFAEDLAARIRSRALVSLPAAGGVER